MTKYSTPVDVVADAAQQTPAAISTKQAEQAEVVVEEKIPDSSVTPEPSEPVVLGTEERVEYRDQNGNLLNKDEVDALEKEGNVKFQTSYEVRTRLVDPDGHEIPDNAYAPPHPDVEGQNPETGGNPDADTEGNQPASVDGEEKSVEQKDQGQAKPASEGNEATV